MRYDLGSIYYIKYIQSPSTQQSTYACQTEADIRRAERVCMLRKRINMPVKRCTRYSAAATPISEIRYSTRNRDAFNALRHFAPL